MLLFEFIHDSFLGRFNAITHWPLNIEFRFTLFHRFIIIIQRKQLPLSLIHGLKHSEMLRLVVIGKERSWVGLNTAIPGLELVIVVWF